MKKGTQLFWEISEFSIAPEELAALGFGDFVPRNDFRSAMIKALHKYVKGNERLYRRFDDNHESVSFGVFVQETGGGDIAIAKELILKVDKKTGRVDAEIYPNQLKLDYDAGKITLNSNQIRSMIPRFIRDNHGVSMRRSGGMYFLDNRHDNTVIEKLRLLFQMLPGSALREITLHDDAGTLDSIEEAISQTYQKEIDDLVAAVEEGYKKGTITAKQIENRKADAEKILLELKLHETNLRKQANRLKERAAKVSEVLSNQIAVAEGSILDATDFTGLLRSL